MLNGLTTTTTTTTKKSGILLVSNGLDPDQARHFVGPDLGPNCLQSI